MAIRFVLVLLVGSLVTKRYGAANALIHPSSSQSRFYSDPFVSAQRMRHGGTYHMYNPSTTPVTMRSERSSKPNSITSTALRANGSSDKDNEKKPARAKGVYVRPSGAIEQGSGFFVPGLEGPKVRLVIGLVLLAATGINHFVLLGNSGGGDSNNSSNGGLSFSEGIAVIYSVLLLFQFAIEYAKEVLLPSAAAGQSTPTSGAAAKRKLQDSFAAAAAATEVLEQQWSGSSSSSSSSTMMEEEEKEYRSRVQWAAASYLSMTPTTQIMLLACDENDAGGGTVRYRLGGIKADPETSDDEAATTVSAGVRAALDELKQSKGGRIALPLTHPAVKALLPVAFSSSSSSGKDSSATTTTSDNENNDDADDPRSVRTVILQRINDGSCWMASSDQLLAGYTSGDLKWLGKLADYVRD